MFFRSCPWSRLTPTTASSTLCSPTTRGCWGSPKKTPTTAAVRDPARGRKFPTCPILGERPDVAGGQLAVVVVVQEDRRARGGRADAPGGLGPAPEGGFAGCFEPFTGETLPPRTSLDGDRRPRLPRRRQRRPEELEASLGCWRAP